MESSTDVVRRLFAAVEQRDLEALVACYHEDVEITEAASLPYGGVHHGRDGVLAHVTGFVRCWGAYQDPEDGGLGATFLEGTDGTVAAVFRHRATDPATGETFDGREVGVYELRDGLVWRSQMFHADTAAVLEFLAGRGGPGTGDQPLGAGR